MCTVFGLRYNSAHNTVPGSIYVNLTTPSSSDFLMMSCTALGFHITSHPACRDLHGEGAVLKEWAAGSSRRSQLSLPLLCWIKLLLSLLLQASFIRHMHMCLPLTLSSADLCEGPRGKVEILLRLLREWPALERVSKG